MLGVGSILSRRGGIVLEPAVHLGDEVLEQDGVGGDVAGADDLVGPVGGAVPGAAEQQPGDVGAGDEDVGGGGELGEQPVGRTRTCPDPFMPCTAEVRRRR